MKIIVTGSLGHVGKLLTQQLVKPGNEVGVITSSPGRKGAIEAAGANALIGSLKEADFLADSFAGAEAVFAMVPPNFGEFDQVNYYHRIGGNYVTAIKKAGIKKVVHLSSIGANLEKGTGFILGSHRVESMYDEELKDITIVHLRPGYFYTNLNNFADVIRHAGFITANYGGDDKMVMAAADDIADAAAEELTSGSAENKIRYIVSDDRTGNEVASALGEAIGKPGLKWITSTNEQMKEGMGKNGMPAEIVDLFVEMGGAIHSGEIRKHFDETGPHKSGKIKVEDYAKDFANIYGHA